MNKPEWLTPEEVAAWLAVTPVFLQNLRLDRTGPAYDVYGAGIVRYDRRIVDEWLTANTVSNP